MFAVGYNIKQMMWKQSSQLLIYKLRNTFSHSFASLAFFRFRKFGCVNLSSKVQEFQKSDSTNMKLERRFVFKSLLCHWSPKRLVVRGMCFFTKLQIPAELELHFFYSESRNLLQTVKERFILKSQHLSARRKEEIRIWKYRLRLLIWNSC